MYVRRGINQYNVQCNWSEVPVCPHACAKTGFYHCVPNVAGCVCHWPDWVVWIEVISPIGSIVGNKHSLWWRRGLSAQAGRQDNTCRIPVLFYARTSILRSLLTMLHTAKEALERRRSLLFFRQLAAVYGSIKVAIAFL